MTLQLLRRIGRAGERDHILTGEVVEQVAGAADNELKCAFRENAGFHDHARERVRHIGRDRCRFRHDGDARKQRRRQLFEHAPAGKIEGIDVDCDAVQRRHDMLAGERAAFAHRLDSAIQQECRIRQFAASLARVDEQRPDAAVDIDQVIRPRGSVWNDSL